MYVVKGGSPGLVVMGVDSYSEGHGFNSSTVYWMDNSSHLFAAWKDEIFEKEARDGPFFNYYTLSASPSCLLRITSHQKPTRSNYNYLKIFHIISLRGTKDADGLNGRRRRRERLNASKKLLLHLRLSLSLSIASKKMDGNFWSKMNRKILRDFFPPSWWNEPLLHTSLIRHNVTRFGEILPLGQKIQSLWQFFGGLI